METETDSHEAQFLANLACDKLRDLAADNNDDPFFLRVDIWGPHSPYLAAQEFLDMYPPEEIEEGIRRLGRAVGKMEARE